MSNSFVTPWTVACQAPLSTGFSRALEWVAVPSCRDLSDPGIKPASLTSPALAGSFITTRAIWEVYILMVPQIYLFHLSPLLHSYSGFQNIHLMKLNCNQSNLAETIQQLFITNGEMKGQGGLVCVSPQCGKELDTTGKPNNNGEIPKLSANHITSMISLVIQCYFLTCQTFS